MDEQRRGNHFCSERAGDAGHIGRDLGKTCSIDLRIDDIREELCGRPYDPVAVGWKHLTRPAYADAIRTAVGASERSADLTQSELLVLMCIAYFQPITRAELSSFFGKEISRDLIGNFRSFGFIASRHSQVRRTPYVTTQAFLLKFGLDTLRDLPDFEALENAGLLSKESCLPTTSCRSSPAAKHRASGSKSKTRLPARGHRIVEGRGKWTSF